MSGPIEVEASRDNTVATVDITARRLRHGRRSRRRRSPPCATSVLPQTVGKVDGVEYAVTGTTALDKDWETAMMKTAPLVFGFVLIFAFLILLASFRSLVVAIKAIVLNLLSVGAAYGILVAAFQWGWGESLLDFESNGGITPWLPMFLFVILFGLSMDYHVFILSRVREAYDRGLSNEDAVAHGIKSSAGVVTSAAVVMVGTFSVFALLPVIDMKEMGIGLAAAVLIDATLIRAVLLPATMKLLGDRNWYLPSWLEWLPRLEHEPAPEGHAGTARSGVALTPPRRRRRATSAAPPAFTTQDWSSIVDTAIRTDLRTDVSRTLPCSPSSLSAPSRSSGSTSSTTRSFTPSPERRLWITSPAGSSRSRVLGLAAFALSPRARRPPRRRSRSSPASSRS